MLKRSVNTRRILEHIFENQPVSRERIGDIVRLKQPVLSTYVSSLRDRALITEQEYKESSGGRKAALLALNPHTVLTIGISIDFTKSIGILMSSNAEILIKYEESTGITDSRENLLREIRRIVDYLIRGSPRDPAGIRSARISFPGLSSSRTSSFPHFPKFNDWHDLGVLDELAALYEMPFLLEKDVYAVTLGEKYFGAGKGIHDWVYLLVDDGIGLGIVIDGKIYKGNSNVGELGHIIMEPNSNLMCYCGNYGCLETSASAVSIVKNVKNELGKGAGSLVIDLIDKDMDRVDIDVIHAAARKNDRLVTNILQRAGTHIGVAITNVVNLLNPELLACGGRLLESDNVLLETIMQTIKHWTLVKAEELLQMKRTSLGRESVTIGAATYAITHFIRNVPSE